MPSDADQVRDWLENLRNAWKDANGGPRTQRRDIFLDLERAIANEPRYIREAVWRALSANLKQEFIRYAKEARRQRAIDQRQRRDAD